MAVILEALTIGVGADADTIWERWIDDDADGVNFYPEGAEVTNDSRLEPPFRNTLTVGATVQLMSRTRTRRRSGPSTSMPRGSPSSTGVLNVDCGGRRPAELPGH